MDLTKLSTGDKIIGATGLLLVVVLVVFPWHHVSAYDMQMNVSFDAGAVNRSAVQSPNAFWGILALLLTLAIVGSLFLRRLTDAELPSTPVPPSQLTFFGTIGVLVLLMLKFVIETSALGIGAFLAILLAGGMTYGGYLSRSEVDPSRGPSGQFPPPPASAVPPPAPDPHRHWDGSRWLRWDGSTWVPEGMNGEPPGSDTGSSGSSF